MVLSSLVPIDSGIRAVAGVAQSNFQIGLWIRACYAPAGELATNLGLGHGRPRSVFSGFNA